jgi:hypothetical protein
LRHLDRPHRATLIPVLAACALAPMARYVGVVFVAAVVVLARRHRVHDAIAASAAGLAPLAMWLVWGAVASGAEGAAGRTPAWHPPAVGEVITQLTRTVGTFWVSGYGPRLGLVVIALVLATVTPRRSEYLVYGVILVVGTVALLLVTWAVLDRTTVLDSRLLVLAHLGAVLALPFVVGSGRWREGALACAAALVLVGSIHWSVGFAASESRQYAADEWRRSPTLAAAEALGAAPLYSNRADLVWWATGRRTALLPVKTDLRSGSARPWQREVGRLPAGALVVLFDRAPGRFMLSAAELGSVRAVRLVRRLPDGAIYEIEARGAQPH